MQKNNNSFILVYLSFVKDLKRNFSCKIYKKPHKNNNKFFFVPMQSAWND